MIQQQLYTRERRGLFRNSEGYDSVAKSPGLTDAFIKEQVHPFCVYNPPKALQIAGSPAEEYPRALTAVHFPDGSLLMGQAVYVAADFTGQRPAFFAHNYMVPPEEAETLNIMEALRETEFFTAYDIENGKELPELPELPRKKVPLEPKLGKIDRGVFCKIMYCLLASASGTKKTYIVTPVPATDTPAYAQALLEALFPCMPPPLRSTLGFCTYSRDPENKKGLHLIFLEKDTIRINDPRTARDFVLDLGRNQYTQMETDPEKSPFLSYQYEYFLRDIPAPAKHAGPENGPFTQTEAETELLERFAAQFPESLSLPQWDDIALLFFAYRRADYIHHLDIEEFKRLYAAARRYLPLTRAGSGEMFDLRRFTVSMAREQRDDIDMKAVFSAYAHTLPWESLLGEMDFWVMHAGETAYSAAFVQSIRGRAHELIAAVPGAEAEAAAAAVNAYKMLKAFHAEKMPEKNAKAFTRLVLSVILAVDEALLERIRFDRLTPMLLASLPHAFIKRGLERKDPAPFILLRILCDAAQALTADGSGKMSLRYMIGSYKLDAGVHEKLARKLREFYQSHIVPAHFENIAYLFRGAEKPELDADELISYVDTYGGAEKAAFMVWAFETHLLNPQNAAHADAARRLIKNNIKDAAFKEAVHTHANLKALSKEGLFGRLTGKR